MTTHKLPYMQPGCIQRKKPFNAASRDSSTADVRQTVPTRDHSSVFCLFDSAIRERRGSSTSHGGPFQARSSGQALGSFSSFLCLKKMKQVFEIARQLVQSRQARKRTRPGTPQRLCLSCQEPHTARQMFMVAGIPIRARTSIAFSGVVILGTPAPSSLSTPQISPIP